MERTDFVCFVGGVGRVLVVKRATGSVPVCGGEAKEETSSLREIV